MKRLGTGLMFGCGLLALAASAGYAQADTIKIGVVAPLTGGGAPWGTAAAEAMRLAAEDYNSKGGMTIGGKTYQIQVIAYDDQYKAADAVAAYDRLRDKDGVKILELQTSPAAVANKQAVEDDQIAAICACASPNAVTKDTKYMTRMNSTPDDYLPGMIKWLADNLKQRRLVLVNPNDEVGQPFVKQLLPFYKQYGFSVLDTQFYDRDTKDFNPLITRILGDSPDVIDLGSTPPAITGLVVRQIRDQGYKGLIIKTAAPSPYEIIASAGKEAAEGMIVNLFADQSNPGWKDISARYQKAVGQVPNEMLVPMYDGSKALLRAVELSGDPNDTAKIVAAFDKALPMTSVQGDEMVMGGQNTIGVNREIISTEYIGVIKDGQPVVLGKFR
jgi:branched-chain amino acid transport system substrate-binding protein